MRIGEWQVNLETGALVNGSLQRNLTPRSTTVLKHLVENAGQLVTSTELLDRYWRGTLSADNAVQKAISEIRAALNDPPGQARFIKTVHKRGYVFHGNEPEAQATSVLSADLVEIKLLMQPPSRSRALHAIELLETACENSPGNTEVIVFLAETYVYLSECDNSWLSYEPKIASLLDDIDQTAPCANVLAIRGLSAQLSGKTEQAHELFSRAIDLDPTCVNAHAHRYRLWLTEGEQDALSDAPERLLPLDPMSPSVNILLAEICSVTSEPALTRGYLERAITLGSNQVFVLLRAGWLTLWRFGDFDSAVDFYLQAYHADPEDVRAPIAIMSVAAMLGLDEEMAIWYRRALKLSPQARDLAFWRAPGAPTPFAQRRSYVQTMREQQPHEREWLRVSGELELELAQAVGEPLHQQSLERAFDHFLNYLVLGEQIVLDETGQAVAVNLQNDNLLTAITFTMTAEAVGQQQVAINICESLIKRYETYLHKSGRQHLVLCFAYARLARTEEALQHMRKTAEYYLPVGLFRLLGADNPENEDWHGLAKKEEFKQLFNHAQQIERDAATRIQPLLQQIEVSGGDSR